MRPSHTPPRYRRDDDFVELESLVAADDDDADVTFSPDDPISMTPPPPPSPSQQRLPKWLSQSHPRSPWYRRLIGGVISSAILLFRPRLSLRYLVLAPLCIYTLYCTLRGVPLLASPLPSYTGPHGVGAIDIELPLRDGPVRVSDAVFKSSREPAFDVETVLLTVYYPTDRSFRSAHPRYRWIPEPVSLTAEGFARVAHLDNFITRPVFTFLLWAVAGSITIPAEVDAPLFTGHGDTSRLPVTVFSHGMASSRSDYTNLLGELASRGHVVAALEHRDGSCPGSMVKLHADDPGRRRLHIRESDLHGGMGTPEFKQTQLAFRDAEIRVAIELLTSIDQGSGVDFVTANNTRTRGASTFSTWPSRLDLSLLTIAGHSYGATGALQALSTVAPDAAAGVILDPGKSSGPLSTDAKAPLLIIHSNSWSRSHSIFYGRPHFDTVRDLARNAGAPSWFLTSLGTSHPSVTDAPLLEPLLLSWTTGSDLDVKGALRQYVDAADAFMTSVARGEPPTGLLAEDVTHEEYDRWLSDERKKEFPKHWAKLWQIHVSPDV